MATSGRSTKRITHSTTTHKATAKKKNTGQQYSPRAQKKVEEEMHEFNRGKLHSGGSDKKVTNPKQAIAIGLSEARREGAKVPAAPKRTKKAA